MATSMAMLEDIVARLGTTMEETRKEMAESRKELDRVLAESRKETDRILAELSKNIGGLNNSIGEIVEMIVIPGVMNQMNKFEHHFTIASPTRRYSENYSPF